MARRSVDRKWVAALTLAVLAAAVAWGVASAPSAVAPEPELYPELLVADEATTSLMCRMVADARLDEEFRHTLVVALCRPGDAAAEQALVDVATDDRQPHGFREFLLQRIARCGGPAPRRLRDLQCVPFGRVAATAAATLAQWGDVEASSQFERGRREYLASDRRRREMATTSLDVVLAAKDDDFDLAAALLVPDDKDGRAGERLEQLDRLARLVRRDVGASPTPSAWIEALNRRLLSSPRVKEWDRDESDLGDVMSSGYGNCLGLSSLYLAVAERLDLPLYGVGAPGHVFVRWDDGTFRRNIEATDRGDEHDDGSYSDGRGGTPIREEDVQSGAYLSNMSKRRFLALALVNRSISDAHAGRAARAAEDAEWAVRLAPTEANTRVARARCCLASERSRAAEDLRAAEKARRLSPGESIDATDTYVKLGLADDAIRVASAACAAYPTDVVVTLRRASALACGRRFDEARRTIDQLPAERPDVKLGDVELRFVSGDPTWRDRLADAVKHPVADPRIHLVLAEDMLDGVAGAAPSPNDARAVLDMVSGLTSPRSLDSSTDFNEAVMRDALIHEEIGDPKRRYYELRARCARALHDDAGASAAQAALRDIDAEK